MTASAEQSEAAANKRRQALELRLAGATYDVIAKQTGYANKASARRAVHQALEASAPDEEPTALTELARLDAMLTGLWASARRGDVTAVDRVLRIEDQRRLILDREKRRQAEADDEQVVERTGLSDFEKRLRERDERAADSRLAEGG